MSESDRINREINEFFSRKREGDKPHSTAYLAYIIYLFYFEYIS